jgi:hypothetical protein
MKIKRAYRSKQSTDFVLSLAPKTKHWLVFIFSNLNSISNLANNFFQPILDSSMHNISRKGTVFNKLYSVKQ